MESQTVVIVTDHPAMARAIVSRWQEDRKAPSFTVMNSGLWRPGMVPAGDLVLVGDVAEGKAEEIFRGLDRANVSAICLVEDESGLQKFRREFPRLLVVRHGEDWLEVVVQLGTEVLRRMTAISRLRQIDTELSAGQRHAALGKYMLDTRHSFNNALTSVLGNAELLLMEDHGLSAGLREQIDTIHSMALRLHEMMQRFSSLEAEMNFAERGPADGRDPARAYVSGSRNGF